MRAISFAQFGSEIAGFIPVEEAGCVHQMMENREVSGRVTYSGECRLTAGAGERFAQGQAVSRPISALHEINQRCSLDWFLAWFSWRVSPAQQWRASVTPWCDR